MANVEMDEDAADALGIVAHPGWTGRFSTNEELGAIRNGTPIEKCDYKAGDLNKAGAKGRVLGSLYSPVVGFGYFVEWDSLPRTAVFVAASRIKVAVAE